MRDMLSIRDLKAQDLHGLTPEAVTALAAQMLKHIEQQTRELEVKQKLLERKDRDIAWRDAKIEKITFELTRLKRWKYGAKSEAMTAEQRQMFQDTLLEDEADLEAQLAALQAACPKTPAKHPGQHLGDPAARRCPIICAAWSTTTSPKTPPARRRSAHSR
jgi:transposase